MRSLNAIRISSCKGSSGHSGSMVQFSAVRTSYAPRLWFALTRTHLVIACSAAVRADVHHAFVLASEEGERTGHRNTTPCLLTAVNNVTVVNSLLRSA